IGRPYVVRPVRGRAHERVATACARANGVGASSAAAVHPGAELLHRGDLCTAAEGIEARRAAADVELVGDAVAVVVGSARALPRRGRRTDARAVDARRLVRARLADAASARADADRAGHEAALRAALTHAAGARACRLLLVRGAVAVVVG